MRVYRGSDPLIPFTTLDTDTDTDTDTLPPAFDGMHVEVALMTYGKARLILTDGYFSVENSW